ncbi:MAG: CDP-alcohol phosphatidyltransferase family protein [Microbacteriaceae bacterium]
MSTQDDGRGWATIPNLISVVRLLVLTPSFVVVLVGYGSPLLALVLLVVLGITDWIDGQIARRFHQRSAIGAKLDPVADRVSQGVVCIAMTVAGLVPWPITLALVGVDLVFLAALIAKRPPNGVPVSRLGRARTAVLMIAFPLVLLAAALEDAVPWLLPVTVAIAAIGTLMHVVADLTYTVWVLGGTEAQHRDAHPLVD